MLPDDEIFGIVSCETDPATARLDWGLLRLLRVFLGWIEAPAERAELPAGPGDIDRVRLMLDPGQAVVVGDRMVQQLPDGTSAVLSLRPDVQQAILVAPDDVGRNGQAVDHAFEPRGVSVVELRGLA